MTRGFTSAHWMTYKTAAALGGQVRKGARSELAFYVGRTTIEAAEPGQDDKTISFLKTYCVFNADEIDNLPARFAEPAPAPAPIDDGRMPTVDGFVANTGATLRHGGNRAFYSPAHDFVQMPTLAQFNTPACYYATLLHELAHWTSRDSRAPRPLGARFGDEAYAAEELVAELAAAFLCADLGVTNEPRPDHAAYLASWIRVLKADNRAIFKAASLAEKAAGFLHGLQPAELAEAA
jgi:antirestriction protein ArdC